MKRNKIKSWIFEFREIKNYSYLLNSWRNFNLLVFLTQNLLKQEHFMKLFYFRNWSILSCFCSRDSKSSKNKSYFLIKGYLLFLLMVISLFRFKNRMIIKKKNIYLSYMLPIFINYNLIKSINDTNDTLEKSFWSYTLKESLLSLITNKEENLLLPRKKKKKYISELKFCIRSQWFINGVVKVRRRYSSCQIFKYNGIFDEIFFSLINKDIKNMEFSFCSYIDNLISKGYNENNLSFFYNKKIIFDLEQFLENLGQELICYIMPVFLEKAKAVTIKQENSLNKKKKTEFTMQSNDMSHFFNTIVSIYNLIWFKKKERFIFNKLKWQVLSNIKYDSTQVSSMRIINTKKKEKSYYNYNKYIDLQNYNYFRNKNSEYKKLIYHTDINNLNEKSIILNKGIIQTELTEKTSDSFNLKIFDLYRIFLEIDKRLFIKSLPEGFILNFTRYFYSVVDNFNNIISDIYMDMGSKFINNFNIENKEIGELFKIIIYFLKFKLKKKKVIGLNNKILVKKGILLNKKTFFDLGIGMRSKILGNEQIKINSTLFYTIVNYESILLQKLLDIFTLSIPETDPFFMYHKPFVFSIDPGPSLYIYSFLKKLDTYFLLKKKKLVQIYYKTNRYGYIINLLKLIYRKFFIINRSNILFKYVKKYLIKKEDKIGINKVLNNITILRYIINKHLSNFNIKNSKTNNNLFYSIISQTDIYINRDHYSSKKMDGINNLFFISLLKIVKLVVNQLRINQSRLKSKYFSELLFLFLYKSLNYLFINKFSKNKSFDKLSLIILSLKNYKFFININEKNKKKNYTKNDSPSSIIFYNKDNWLETLNKNSLLTYFFKRNPFKLIKNKNNLWFYHKRIIPFKKIKPYLNTSHFLYGNLLDDFILYDCKNIIYVNVGKKEYSYSKWNSLLPIKLRVFDISIENNLSKIRYKYKLNYSYNYLHFTNKSKTFLHKSIYLLKDSYETDLAEEKRFILEKNNCKSISYPNSNIFHFERDDLYKYLILNLDSIMDLQYTSFFKNNLTLPLVEHKKEHNIYICKNKYIYNFKTPINFNQYKNIIKRISYISRWDRLQAYIPCLLTLTGWIYIKSIILDSIFDILLKNIQNIVSIFYDTPNISDTCKLITHKLIINLPHIQNIPINDTFHKILQNIILSEKFIKSNSRVFLAHSVSKNTRELLYLIYFFFFTSGYIIFTQLLFFYQAYFELQSGLENIKSLTIPSYMMEFKNILYRYPLYKLSKSKSELKFLGLNHFFLVITEQLENYFFDIKMLFRGDNQFIKYCNNFYNFFVNILPKPINRILFSKNTIFLSKISKDLFLLINKRKNIKNYWIDEKIEIGVSNSISIFDEEERKFLVQFLTLKTEKNFLSVLAKSDLEFLSKNRFSYKISEQPGFISLHYLLYMHQRDIITYIFKKSILLERQIFFSHFHKTTYSHSQIFCGLNISHEKPFSIRLSLSYKGVLVIGSIGMGRSSLIKYLAKNPYIPLITIYISKFWGSNQKTTNIYSFDNPAESVEDTNDLDMNMLTMSTTSNFDQLGLILQFELAKEMSPCIIWIPKIHNLQISEFNYFSLGIGILDNYLFEDFDRSYIGKIIVLASTHIPQKVDPALIATNRLNICIKIRGLILSQQRKQFFIISYTRGFYFENIMLQNKNINTGSFAMSDLVTFSDEVLSLSITQNNYNIKINTILFTYHRRNWNSLSQIRSIKNNDIFLYQIGRAFIKNVFLYDCLLDPLCIYINMKNKSCIRWNSSLYKWYFEFGTSIKRLTILFYIFSCSAGLVAKDIWSLHKEGNKILSYEFVDNEFYIVKGILQLEVYGSTDRPECLEIERELSKFYNNKITLFNQLKSKYRREWFDMIKSGSLSLIYNNFLKQNYELEFDKSEEEGKVLSLFQFEEDLGQNIVWAPRIGRLGDNLFNFIEKISDLYFPYWNKNIYYSKVNELQEKDLKLLSFKYQLRTKYRFYEENLKGLVASQTKFPTYTSKRWFLKKKQKENLDFLMYNQRFFIVNRFFSNILTLSESYHYLLNMFLSNKFLFDQLIKYLLRNKWLFSDEINSLISVKLK
uniref:Ycf2 protein n=1 Tax=Gastrodia elata TaxID=91201 RepID=A0A6G7L1F3_9ASPA|nr:Ycf2 protein [Gastrodia elata]